MTPHGNPVWGQGTFSDSETALGATYSRRLFADNRIDYGSWGATARWFVQTLDGRNGSGLRWSAGLTTKNLDKMFLFPTDLVVSAVLHSSGDEDWGDGHEEPSPAEARLGAAYDVVHGPLIRWTVAADDGFVQDGGHALSLGTQMAVGIEYGPTFLFRTGVLNAFGNRSIAFDDPQFTVGAGVELPSWSGVRLQFDIAYLHNQVLRGSLDRLHVSLAVGW